MRSASALAVKFGPLSERIFFGIPRSATQNRRNADAVAAAVASCRPTMTAYKEKLSTMTRKYEWPSLSVGNGPAKSMEINSPTAVACNVPVWRLGPPCDRLVSVHVLHLAT